MNNKNIPFYSSPHALAGLSQKEPVLLALSGGADSSALLHILSEDAKSNGFIIHVAHLNHSIRGEEAERDALFCQELAKKYGAVFHLCKLDIPSLAKKSGKSIETEARDQRYAFFERIMREYEIPLLVTAHHADDQIESVLLHVLRGSGIAGLCGISPCRSFADGLFIVRPLLKAERRDILSYCEDNKIEYVTDSTNFDTVYTRNAIRAELTPKMRELQPALSSVFAKLCESATEANDFITQNALDFLNNECEDSIPLAKFNSLNKAVASRVLLLAFEQYTSATLERVHVEALIELCAKARPHSSLSLPKNTLAKVERGTLVFTNSNEEKETEEFEIPFCLGKTEIHGTIINIEKNPKDNATKNALTINIKCEHLSEGASLRSRRDGDVILSGKMNKKVKKLFNEKKIPLNVRASVPILCVNNEILWIPSVAVCDRIKTDKINNGDDFYRISVKLVD